MKKAKILSFALCLIFASAGCGRAKVAGPQAEDDRQAKVAYTFEDQERDVAFSIEYPQGWELTELLAWDGDERRDASPTEGVRFTFFGDEEEMFSVMASLFSPFGVDESMFEAESFETDAGILGVKYSRETDGRVAVYYIFGDGETLPQYSGIVIMSAEHYETEGEDIEAVMKSLKIPGN